MIRYYQQTLLSLFKDVNNLRANRDNVELCYTIQESVIRLIRRIESRIRAIKGKECILKDIISNGRLAKEESKIKKEQLKNIDFKKEAYHKLLLVIKDIGDAIAFIYLNKWDIKPLGVGKESPGFISRKKGFRKELKMFRLIKQQQQICIFNDITNSLRYGDLTLPVEGMPYIIEVKTKKSRNERVDRQLERANRVTSYLFNDETKGLYPGTEEHIMVRVAAHKKEVNHQLKLTALLTEALKENKNILSEVEPGLFYSIVVNEALDDELNKLPKKEVTVAFVNQLKDIKQAYFPFTLSISDPYALFKFYQGECAIAIFLDIEYFTRAIRKKGYSVSFCDDPNYRLHLRHTDTSVEVKISHHFFNRLFAEFLSLKWMVGEVCKKDNLDSKTIGQ